MIETVITYGIAALLALSGLVTILLIGRPREPITPTLSFFSVIVNALIALWIIHLIR